MGRAKLVMKRIENDRNRQVSLCKRRNGLLKKAYELCVLTDIDIALLIFSPSARLTHFSGKTRMENVFTRFVELSSHEIQSARWHPQEPTTYCDFPNKEDLAVNMQKNLLRTLQQLKSQDNASTQLLASSSVNPDTAENLQQQISTLQQQIQAAKEEIRMYVPDTLEDKSFEELESLENLLSFTLTRISQRKEYLLANMPPLNPSSSSVLQTSFQQMSVDNQIKWLPEYEPSPSQMCIPSEPLLPIGNLSSTILFQLRQEEETGEASAWSHRLTCHSQEQPSTMVSLSPSIYYPQFQQDTGVAEQMPNMGDQEIMPCEQVEKTITATDSIQDQQDTKQLQFSG